MVQMSIGRCVSILLARWRRGRWDMRRGTRLIWAHLGWTGLLLPLALIGVVVAVSAQHWKAQRFAQLQSLAKELPAAQFAAPLVTGDVDSRIARFRTQLPERAALPQRVGELLTAAEAAGLTVAKADYRVQPDPAAGFLRYRVSMPLRGPAAKVLPFIQQAMRVDPALALEGIQIKRDSPESSEIEVSLRWVLFARHFPERGRS